MHRAAANYYFCDPKLILKVMQDCHTTLYYYILPFIIRINISKASYTSQTICACGKFEEGKLYTGLTSIGGVFWSMSGD